MKFIAKVTAMYMLDFANGMVAHMFNLEQWPLAEQAADRCRAINVTARVLDVSTWHRVGEVRYVRGDFVYFPAKPEAAPDFRSKANPTDSRSEPDPMG